MPQSPSSVRRCCLTRRAGARLGALLLYAALAVYSTWPLVKTLDRTVPMTTMAVTTVPLLNAWTMWWNVDRLEHGFRDYWDSPIFFPARDTFAFSEPQTTTLLVAPVLWLSGSRILAYNVWLLASLVLNGVFAERFLRVCGARGPSALCGGSAMVLLPIVHWQLEVVQLVPVWGFLWMWTALVQNQRCPDSWRGLEIGLAFGVAFLTCVHQGLFAAVLAPCAVVFVPWRGLFRTFTAWGLAALVGVAFVVPVALPMKRAFEEHGFTRTPKLVAELSAIPGDYTATPGLAWIDRPVGARNFWKLSCGWAKYGLAIVGIGFGLWRRKWRRVTAFLLLTGLLAFFLSLGPNLNLWGWQPWWTVSKYCPGFSQVRNVFRFAYFVQMPVVLLAALSIHALVLLGHRYLARGLCWMVTIVSFILGAAAVLEVRPQPPSLLETPDVTPHLGWIQFVRQHTPPGRGLLCLPYSFGDSVESLESMAKWMYFGTYHGRPLVNGYSGFFPAEYYTLRDEIHHRFLSEALLVEQHELGVEFVLIDRRPYPAAELDGTTFGTIRLELAYKDSQSTIDVYRIRVRPSPTFR